MTERYPLVAVEGVTVVRDGWVCCAVCGVPLHNEHGLCASIHSAECERQYQERRSKAKPAGKES
jgi:hypothetical protein